MDFFESIVNDNWDLTTEESGFDPVKVQEYLDQLNGSDQEFVREVLNNTTHITYEKFKTMLLTVTQKFIDTIGDKPFYILLDEKVNSQDWILAIIWPLIRKLNVIDVIYEDSDVEISDQPVTVVIFDDMLYTGQRIMELIERFLYCQDLITGHASTAKFHEKAPLVSFKVVCPLSTDGVDFDSFMTGLVPHCPSAEKLPQIQLLLEVEMKTLEQLIDISKYYDKEGDLVKLLIFSLGLPLVIFDHKVAGNCSTYSQIYLEGITSEVPPEDMQRYAYSMIDMKEQDGSSDGVIYLPSDVSPSGNFSGMREITYQIHYCGSLLRRDPDRSKIEKLKQLWSNYEYRDSRLRLRLISPDVRRQW